MMAATPDPALLAELRSALDSTYEIEGEIGGGGMSRVFGAVERALGRRVVIKVLPPELTAGVNREGFAREIQFAPRLQPPHIAPLLAAGQVGDILYYTMPFVEGESLRNRLEKDGPQPAARVLAILQDVVDALAYAHSLGLVHRDIKPENILIQRGHALVTDFGVAKAISESLPGTAATTIGVAVGTPAYMAPEQLPAAPAADHRMDLYAAGLLAYELLSGSSPFSGSSPQQTLARQLTERPTPPHIQRADVPAELSAIIMRCLEKEPAARFASAEELLQALGAVRITSSGIRAITRTLEIDLTRKSPARRTLFVAGGIALAVALGGVAYAFFQPGTRPVAPPARALTAPPVPPPATPPPPGPPRRAPRPGRHPPPATTHRHFGRSAADAHPLRFRRDRQGGQPAAEPEEGGAGRRGVAEGPGFHPCRPREIDHRLRAPDARRRPPREWADTRPPARDGSPRLPRPERPDRPAQRRGAGRGGREQGPLARRARARAHRLARADARAAPRHPGGFRQSGAGGGDRSEE